MEKGIPRPCRDPEAGYSRAINKRLKSSPRTGQACDRCKFRKIKCDTKPGGCGACLNSHSECKTTDRITGRATTRGHTDRLEDDNRHLRAHVHALLKRLKESNVDAGDLAYGPSDSRASPRPSWTNSQPLTPTTPGTISTVIPTLSRPSLPTSNSGLELFRGTKLSLFGREIDGSQFDDSFQDNRSPKSYQGLMIIQQQNHENNIPDAQLPATKNEALQWARWYFLAVHPFVPAIHKPDMFALLEKVYADPTRQVFESLSLPEKITVHMMFATIKHQAGQRNGDRKHIEEAERHFLTCNKYLPALFACRSLQQVQALAVISVFARNYQQPEAAWFIIHPALWAAVENGLNRSHTTLPEYERSKLTEHDIQMRRRIFWVIFILGTTLSGRLGRPLPLRMQDIDIEFPDPVPDNLPTETDLSEYARCSFRLYIVGAKLNSIFSQLYSNIYTVRRNLQTYEADVAELVKEHRDWQLTIPKELQPDTAVPESTIHAWYVRTWDLEFQFLLHHPAPYPFHDPSYRAFSLRSTMATCEKFLEAVKVLNESRTLDCQWVNISLLLAFLFTLLYLYDQKQNEITYADVEKLRADLDAWHMILRDLGEMQGIGTKLQDTTRGMMDKALESHERRLATNRSKPQSASIPPVLSNGNTVPSDPHQSNPNDRKRSHNSIKTESRVAPELLGATDESSYQNRSYQPINGPINNSIPSFQPATPYNNNDSSYQPNSQPSTPLPAGYQSNHFYGPPSVSHPPPFNQDWLAWSQQYMPMPSNPVAAASANSVATPPQSGSQDYIKYNSASTLVSLRAGDPTASAAAVAAAGLGYHAGEVDAAAAQIPMVWPLSFLEYTPGAGS